ncbi:MAG: TIGR03905 family TSCPD domain-containing protein [Clostridiales bacterium]|nr:TIGR03905 family TSCPD domain-containing protein [Clostridiales bacterium]
MDKVYITRGVCSTKIHFNVENGLLHKVQFENGCSGNLIGIGRLIEGMPVDEAIAKLKGIPCGRRGTSCPDQLARALEQYQALNPPE